MGKSNKKGNRSNEDLRKQQEETLKKVIDNEKDNIDELSNKESEEIKENKTEIVEETAKDTSNDSIQETQKESKKEKSKDNSKDKKRQDETFVEMIFREAFEWIMCILIAFALAVTIKFFIFTPTLVKQSSMYPTIFDGERVFVNRLTRTFKLKIDRGDIVTLEAPSGSISQDNIRAYYDDFKGIKWFTYEVLEIGKISYIKRVIGIAGDTIKIEDGKVYLNGEELDESEYLPDGTQTYISDTFTHIKSEFTVPEGYVFAMGDNRSYSRDCRELGCIPIEKIEGKVLFRLWPISKFGGIKKSEITKEEVDKYDEEMQRIKL